MASAYRLCFVALVCYGVGLEVNSDEQGRFSIAGAHLGDEL
jgi:hypothetical protein